MDLERIEKAVREILLAVGEDPEREGLQETPNRVARMYAEIFSGLKSDPKQHLKIFHEEGEHDELVFVRDIPLYSVCEHHLLPFIGKCHLNPRGVAVFIEAEHLCMTMRGARAAGALTQTSALRGCMRTEAKTRNEVMLLLAK